MNPSTTVLGVPRTASGTVVSEAAFAEAQALIASLLRLNGTAVESAPFVAGRNVSLAALNFAAGSYLAGLCTCNCAAPSPAPDFPLLHCES